MPITSYQEMASAACTYPGPPAFLPFDFLDRAELQQISYCYRGLTLVEGRPDADGIYLSRFRLGQSQLTDVQLGQTGLRRVRLQQSVLTSVGTED